MKSPHLLVLIAAQLLFPSWPGSSALAQTFDAHEEVEAGRPPRPLQVHVASTPGQDVELRVGKGIKLTLPLKAALSMSAQSVVLEPGAAVAVVQVQGPEGQQAGAILSRRGGKPKVLWSGQLGLRGDPGERHGHAIEIADRTGDGSPDVIVAELSERSRVCGQERTLLRPQAIDPKSLTLRPVTLDPLADSGRAVVDATASTQGPGPNGPPVLQSLKPIAASSQPGETTAWMANPPTAIADGDLGTSWVEGRGAGGRGEYVTFRRTGGNLPIRALAITPVPSTPPTEAWSRAAVISLAGESGPRIRLQLPDAPKPGERYWFVPTEPLPWHCVSLIIEQAVPVSPHKSGRVLISEVEAYTELDFGGGLESLIADLQKGSERATRATDLLIGLGAAALPPLSAAWPTFQSRAQRRAVRILSASAPHETLARESLLVALDAEHEETRDAALNALIGAGKAGWLALLPRIADQSPLGDRVALALSRRAPAEVVDASLAALSTGTGSERAALREALTMACQQAGDTALTPIESWRKSDAAPIAARAAAALALAGIEHPAQARALAATLVLETAAEAEEFPDRWRLVQAASLLPSEPTVDQWLAKLAADEERWMLRASAITALKQRQSPLAEQTARKGMADSYPRVRLAGAEALAGADKAVERLAKHARQDRWPMVRAAALIALASSKGTGKNLRKGLADRVQSVRAAAVKALRIAGARDAWPAVRQRMVDKDEWPVVVTQTVRFARDLCIDDAAEPLLTLLRRGLKPNAWEPDVQVALLALEALRHLGGKPAKAAIALASAPAAPTGFKAAAHAAEKQKPECSRVR